MPKARSAHTAHEGSMALMDSRKWALEQRTESESWEGNAWNLVSFRRRGHAGIKAKVTDNLPRLCGRSNGNLGVD